MTLFSKRRGRRFIGTLLQDGSNATRYGRVFVCFFAACFRSCKRATASPVKEGRSWAYARARALSRLIFVSRFF